MVRPIHRALLAEVAAEAAASPRRRKNRNFHPTDDHPAHRLLNALEPDSYIPPHRHLDPLKDETMLVLQGRLALLTFDEAGQITGSLVAGPAEDTLGFDIPHGVFHTVFALEAATVFLEAKAGPYLPLTEAEKAPWAPAEGSPEATSYFAHLKVSLA